MKGAFKKFFTNGWTVGVCTSILATGILSWVGLLNGFYKWLLAPHAVNGWIILIGAIAVIAVLCWLVWEWLDKLAGNDYLDYREDTFWGVTYIWEWTKGADGIYEVDRINPKCKVHGMYLTDGNKCLLCNKTYQTRSEDEIESVIHYIIDSKKYRNKIEGKDSV